MDFSSLNSAEQAHMSKVIEKKQVCSDYVCSHRGTDSNVRRCKTSSGCTPTSSNGASLHVVMTSQARHYHRRRSVQTLSLRRAVNADGRLTGNMRDELHGQVLKTFGAGRSTLRRAERRYVILLLFVSSIFLGLTVSLVSRCNGCSTAKILIHTLLYLIITHSTNAIDPLPAYDSELVRTLSSLPPRKQLP